MYMIISGTTFQLDNLGLLSAGSRESCPVCAPLKGSGGCPRRHLPNRNTHFSVSCFSLDNMVLSGGSVFWLLHAQLFLLLRVFECLLHPFVL